MKAHPYLLCTLVCSTLLTRGFGQSDSNVSTAQELAEKMGHSRHGEAFDSGPREKPWEMADIGRSHFPVTSSHPEVQKWFDQGHTLLHSFWFYEAERAFRWCLKLDPECAMAYWGLARAARDEQRSRSFMLEAAKRRDKVTPRERLYIDAWHEFYRSPEPGAPVESGSRQRKLLEALEQIALEYPDDLEARALLALEGMRRGGHLTNELLISQILEKDPSHPGAHHYRIHTWDGYRGEEALDSCEVYGQIASGIGHAQHMPGHIYAELGMWHEAAVSMDAATRVEKNYMKRRLTFPFNNWNYAHNKNYLGYILEQLGMAQAALDNARQLLAAPLDPRDNDPAESGTHWLGKLTLMRALIKFDLWEELLDGDTFLWQDNFRDRMYRSYAEAMANLGQSKLDAAWEAVDRHSKLAAQVEKPDNKSYQEVYQIQNREIRGLYALAVGDNLKGIGLLSEAASLDFEHRRRSNDPPNYPKVLYTTLGEAYLRENSPSLAVQAFEKALTMVREDGFALAGLVEAHSRAGDAEKARQAMQRLLSAWSDADPGLPRLRRVMGLGLDAVPKDPAPRPQRNYRSVSLDHLGPGRWEPYTAPRFSGLDSQGQTVDLKDYLGRNVLLIFYLGEECPHCLDQLAEVGRRRDDFARLQTEVLAVSPDAPEQNAQSEKLARFPFRLISDLGFENARRFKSFDDFEEIELHSTILIDREGRVHWARSGGDPFMEFNFLIKEIERINRAPRP